MTPELSVFCGKYVTYLNKDFSNKDFREIFSSFILYCYKASLKYFKEKFRHKLLISVTRTITFVQKCHTRKNNSMDCT